MSNIKLKFSNTIERVGFRDGVLSATPRTYKYPARQKAYNSAYEFGKRAARYGFEQKLADALSDSQLKEITL